MRNTIIQINNITNVLEITEPLYYTGLNPAEPATNYSNDIKLQYEENGFGFNS